MPAPEGQTAVTLRGPYGINMEGDTCCLPTDEANALVHEGRAVLLESGQPEDLTTLSDGELLARAKAVGINTAEIASRIPGKDKDKFRRAMVESLQRYYAGLKTKSEGIE